MKHLTSREFNQNVSKAKRDALSGPVFVTDRGQPSHVLLSYDEYRRLTSEPTNIVEALSMKGLSSVDFETEKVSPSIKPVDLS
ncbi:type II toxin-antitoxin system Phd/YefM family antitoxin [uncultured Roseobacter sp.]|uniref:type II toxin-antitoxin system Phd/YefM family antitoxin n=1 Tax=uncultured Roseobacter sp. TaxID=114847 RepID=UPI0026068066|nr:type II toxin-antitoxin system Phd/YefM family antitoxin [uncultured Roseobacter sp.]